jgi:hypothetical protein
MCEHGGPAALGYAIVSRRGMDAALGAALVQYGGRGVSSPVAAGPPCYNHSWRGAARHGCGAGAHATRVHATRVCATRVCATRVCATRVHATRVCATRVCATRMVWWTRRGRQVDARTHARLVHTRACTRAPAHARLTHLDARCIYRIPRLPARSTPIWMPGTYSVAHLDA